MGRHIHGMTGTVEHNTWRRIKMRCYNPNSPMHRYYSGRNITMCESWRESFINFYRDMGKRPDWATSIDRIDNDKGYSPDNCRWSNHQQQSENRRFVYSIDGKTLKQWCLDNGRSYKYTQRILKKTGKLPNKMYAAWHNKEKK